MSWLNATEYAVMETAVRDRVEDLRAAADTHVSSTDRAEVSPSATRTIRPCPFRTQDLAPCSPS
jgi:hypothetical protein